MSDTKKPFLNTTRRQALGLLALGASGVVMTGLPGLTRAFAQGAKDAKGQLTIGFSQEPTVFNPHMPHIEVDEGIHFSIFDPLFYVDERAPSSLRSPPKSRPSRMAASPPMVSAGRSSCATT